MTLLTLSDVHYAHPGTPEPLLKGLSLSVGAGEALAIVGPNGVGKSTLLRLAAGLLAPARGLVQLNGRGPLHAWAPRERARQLAFVGPARPEALEQSVLELVLLGRHAWRSRFALASPREVAEAQHALEALGVAHLGARPAGRLSSGELQRVLVARARFSQAPLWLLDEPAAHLDLRHQTGLMACLREHVARPGCAAIAVMHDLNLVCQAFDRAVVLHEGAMAADGPPQEALCPKRLSEIFQIPLERGEVAGLTSWVARVAPSAQG